MEAGGQWFSAEDLAKVGARGVLGIPGTARGCRDKAQREGWPAKQVQGKGGKGGVLTLYQPPAQVLAAIDAVGDLPPPSPAREKPIPASRHIEQPLAGYVAIPLYNGVRAAAGDGALVEHETPDDALVFKEQWVRMELGARPQDLYLIRVAGDSMEPTLRSGDVILVDRRATRPDREGVYILRMNDMLLVKRLQALPGGVVRVISDNAAFAPFDIKAAEFGGAELAIIGRVVWTGRRM
jgi:phage repressor protein C with HTH and peptisase S24 domain